MATDDSKAKAATPQTQASKDAAESRAQTDKDREAATHTQASKDAAEQNAQAKTDRERTDEAPVDANALGLSKHITAWRESYGDDVVDAALELSVNQRKRTASDLADAQKADAAQARAQSTSQSSTTAPTGRSASDPKSTATA